MSANINEVYALLKEVNAKVSKLDEMHEKINTLMLVLQAMEIKRAEDIGGTRNIKIEPVEEVEIKKAQPNKKPEEETKKKSVKKVAAPKKAEEYKINKLDFFRKMLTENMDYFDELLGGNKENIDRENATAWADLDENKVNKEKIKAYYNFIKNDANLDNQLQNMKHGYIAELKKKNIRLNNTEEH